MSRIMLVKQDHNAKSTLPCTMLCIHYSILCKEKRIFVVYAYLLYSCNTGDRFRDKKTHQVAFCVSHVTTADFSSGLRWAVVLLSSTDTTEIYQSSCLCNFEKKTPIAYIASIKMVRWKRLV